MPVANTTRSRLSLGAVRAAEYEISRLQQRHRSCPARAGRAVRPASTRRSASTCRSPSPPSISRASADTRSPSSIEQRRRRAPSTRASITLLAPFPHDLRVRRAGSSPSASTARSACISCTNANSRVDHDHDHDRDRRSRAIPAISRQHRPRPTAAARADASAGAPARPASAARRVGAARCGPHCVQPPLGLRRGQPALSSLRRSRSSARAVPPSRAAGTGGASPRPRPGR